MSQYYAIVGNDEHLEHYGVKGMKWGVRRYQNYDGSRTQAGIKRYREAESRYNEATGALKKAKASGNMEVKAAASRNRKKAKADMERQYRNLKNAKRADKGQELYNRGITIRENSHKRANISKALTTGAAASALILSQIKNGGAYNRAFTNFVPSAHNQYMVRRALMAVPPISAALLAANGVAEAHDRSRNKKLRAYYSYKAKK